jgi:acyl carrier protein
MTDFETALLGKIIERLNLAEVIKRENIHVDVNTPLFKGGLGLDSIDALEISILLEEEYGIVVKVSERNASIFGSLGDLSRFVQENLRRDIAPA